MEDLLRHVRLILRGMWLHHWLGLAVAWAVGLVAVAVVFLLSDTYEATARIFVDTESVLKPLMRGLTVQANTEQQVSMLSRTLISRPNVEKLIRMADLDLTLKSTQEKEALIDSVTRKLQIKSVGRDNLYTLEYRANDPETARKVVQSLATIFVESSLGDKRNDTDSARKFIEEQIKLYQRKLEEAEDRLKEFKLKNIELELDGEKDSGARLAGLNNLLNQSRLELREAENARNAIRQEIMAMESAAAASASSSNSKTSLVPEIDGRLEAMKIRLDALLQQFTEQHPDVKGVRRIIEDLEAQKQKELDARRKAAAGNPSALVSSAVVPETVRSAYANAEAKVASLRVRVAEYENRQGSAMGKLKLMPQIEAEFAQLNRDYAINKRNYDDLIQRRESAAISEGMTAVSGVADFRLIDPPRASPKPVAPNRLMLLAMSLLVALGCGAAASYAATQIRPVVLDARTLREVTGLPYLGMVSRIVTPAERKRQRKNLWLFVAGIAGLAIIYAAAMAVVLFIISRTG